MGRGVGGDVKVGAADNEGGGGDVEGSTAGDEGAGTVHGGRVLPG